MDWIRFSKREIEADALPQVCMDCGEPASCRVSKTFEYVPDWAALLLLAGILPGIIALIVREARDAVADQAPQSSRGLVDHSRGNARLRSACSLCLDDVWERDQCLDPIFAGVVERRAGERVGMGDLGGG